MRFSRRALLAGAGCLAAGAATRGLEGSIFEGVNQQRRVHGLAPLRWGAELTATARSHSRRMLTAGFFAHQDPEFGDLIQRLNAAAIAWRRVAENLHREQGYEDPASRAIAGWLRSPGHRGSLLHPAFTETGIGIAVSPDEEFFITQQFLCR